MQGDFYAGAVAILVAMLFDGLDGRVARLTRTSSAFGAQYDSLSDMVSFGLAPALLTFNWALTGLGQGWLGGGLYLRGVRSACGWPGSTRTCKVTIRPILRGLPARPRQPAWQPLVWMGQTHGWSGPALDWVHACCLTRLGF